MWKIKPGLTCGADVCSENAFKENLDRDEKQKENGF